MTADGALGFDSDLIALTNAQEDPVDFAHNVLGDQTWPVQEAILRALAKPNARVAVRGCHSSSKTFCSSEFVLWFVRCHSDAIAITTAPVARQVEDIMWGEIRRGVLRANARKLMTFPACNLLRLNLGPNNFAEGFTTESADQAVRFQGYHCLAEDHEILTRRGWLGIDDIGLADEVLSIPVDEDVARWMPVTVIHKYNHDGDICRWGSATASFAVTSEHRFLFRGQTGGWRLGTMADMPQRSAVRLRRSSGWLGVEFALPEPFTLAGFDKMAFVQFVGWWLSEGSLRYRKDLGRAYEVIIHQTKPDGCAAIERMLKGIGWYKGVNSDEYTICNRPIADWLMEHCGRYQPERRIPRFLLDAPERWLRVLLDTLMAGDGSAGEGHGRCYYSTSKALIDGLQEVAFKLGQPTTVGLNREAGTKSSTGFESRTDCFVLFIGRSARDAAFDVRDVRTEPYRGRVWCIETPYQTFVTRHRGRVLWSGNSPHLLFVLDEAPGIPVEIFEAIEGSAASGDVRVLMLGNPTIPSGTFYNAFTTQRERWQSFTIDAFDMLNFIPLRRMANGDPDLMTALLATLPKEHPAIQYSKMPFLAQPLWAWERLREWGKDSPLWAARVRGQFPVQGEDSLISLAWIEAAARRWEAAERRAA